MILQVLCALLIIAGLFILLNIHPKDAFAPLLKPLQRRRDRIERVRLLCLIHIGMWSMLMSYAKCSESAEIRRMDY